MILSCRSVSKLKKQRNQARALAYALGTQSRELSWQTLFAWHEAIDSWPSISLVGHWSKHMFLCHWQRLSKRLTSLHGVIKIVNIIPRMDLLAVSSRNCSSERYQITTPLVPHMRTSHSWTLLIWRIIWRRRILISPPSTLGLDLDLMPPLCRLRLLLVFNKSWRVRTLYLLMTNAISQLLNPYWRKK